MTQVSDTAVRVASESERAAGIATQMAAFIADPLIRWFLPRPDQYFTYFPQVLEYFAGGAFDHGTAYCTDNFAGAALWLPPGVHSDEESMGQLMAEALDPSIQGDAFAMLEQIGSYHPDYDHWYLPSIGVDPAFQGKGIGSALLAAALERCDREHLPAYLESSNPRNISLYKRFGFEALGEIRVGRSPLVTPMLRQAR